MAASGADASRAPPPLRGLRRQSVDSVNDALSPLPATLSPAVAVVGSAAVWGGRRGAIAVGKSQLPGLLGAAAASTADGAGRTATSDSQTDVFFVPTPIVGPAVDHAGSASRAGAPAGGDAGGRRPLDYHLQLMLHNAGRSIGYLRGVARSPVVPGAVNSAHRTPYATSGSEERTNSASSDAILGGSGSGSGGPHIGSFFVVGSSSSSARAAGGSSVDSYGHAEVVMTADDATSGHLDRSSPSTEVGPAAADSTGEAGAAAHAMVAAGSALSAAAGSGSAATRGSTATDGGHLPPRARRASTSDLQHEGDAGPRTRRASVASKKPAMGPLSFFSRSGLPFTSPNPACGAPAAALQRCPSAASATTSTASSGEYSAAPSAFSSFTLGMSSSLPSPATGVAGSSSSPETAGTSLSRAPSGFSSATSVYSVATGQP